MSVTIPRGPRPDADEGVRQLVTTMELFVADHSRAEVEVYRHGRFSLRVRVIWDGFRHVSRSDRVKMLRTYLDSLPDEAFTELTHTFLLTREDRADAALNVEFDDPYPSLIDSLPAAHSHT